MATSNSEERCYVCGGKFKIAAVGFECRRCGLVYGKFHAPTRNNLPLVEGVGVLRHKLGRIMGHVLTLIDMIDVLLPPEEDNPDVRQERLKR